MPRVFVAVNVAELRLPFATATDVRAPHHFTLRFLGEVASDRLDGILRAIGKAAARVRPFTIELIGVGSFPGPGRPRIVWIGVGRGRAELTRLAQAVSEELSAEGWPEESRPFSPHLTVLRVHRASDSADAQRLLGLGSAHPFGTAPVDELLLRESRLTREGAVHSTIGAARLVGDVSPSM